MDPVITQWAQKSLRDGYSPLDIAAAVARRAAHQIGRSVNNDGPQLLSYGTLIAPDGCMYRPETVGAVYEQSLDSSTRRNSGVHYTPVEVAQGLADIVLSQAPQGPVCDPSVGGGSFLIAAANFFRQLGVSPSTIVEELLWGIDVDPGAILVTEAALALWASHDDWILPEGNLVVADSLEEGISAFQSPPDGGFSAVIGNPPFQNQLQEQTVRTLEKTKILRERWDTSAGPYADTAGFFLLAGVSMLSDDGVLLMIQPQSFLSVSDSAPIRAELEEKIDLVGMWIGGANIFEAGVHVCAPLFAPTKENSKLHLWEGRRIESRDSMKRNKGDSWTEIISAARGVPRVDLQGPALKEIASATAGFRDQFYGLQPFVCEENECEGESAPLITVGMIDPLRSRWGKGKFRYANKVWVAPVVDLKKLKDGNPELFNWVKDRLRPKVLVATQTKILEVLPDPEGLLVPSTPVVSVECDQENIWLIAAALSSPAVSAGAFARAAGAAMSSDTLKLSATQVEQIPLPEKTLHWEQGAGQVKDAYFTHSSSSWLASLEELGQEMTKAYCSEKDVLEWWHNRLPVWR